MTSLHANFLQNLYEAIGEVHDDELIDLLIERFDIALSTGFFSVADELLEEIDVDKLNSNLIICILCATRRAGSLGHLLKRQGFVDRARTKLTELHPERVERLMEGLD